jgi:carbamoyl-phosphate synthase large subunit
VSKATGVPLAKLATKVMLGRSLTSLGFDRERTPVHVSVKEAVLPFDRFPDVDTLLGPEMKSTGEVMGIDLQFGPAYAKAQLGAGQRLPTSGTVFISVKDNDKSGVLPVAAQFNAIGFKIMATQGTARLLTANNIPNEIVKKVSMGRPHVVDAIKNGEVQLVINTGSGERPRQDGYMIRRAAIKFGIPYATTLAGASAICRGIAALKECRYRVQALQDYHR